MKEFNNLFIFNSEEIHNHIKYEMEIFFKLKHSFNYVHSTLSNLNNHLVIENIETEIDLGKENWSEGKNYNWLAITHKNIKLLIRSYGVHFTIFTKQIEHINDDGGFSWDEINYSAFTFYSNTNNLDDNTHDFYIDNPFHDLNNVFKNIIEHIKDNKVFFIDNSASFKKPKHCEIKLIINNKSIYSIDNLIFACEELSCKHIELFAENDILDKLRNLPKSVIGKSLVTNYKIKEIKTEVKDNYYHNVGLIIEQGNGNLVIFDVYKLTRYYLNEIYKL